MTAAQTQDVGAPAMPEPPPGIRFDGSPDAKLQHKTAMLDYYWRLSQFAVAGNLAPKGMNESACVIAMVFGEGFDMDPIQSLWNIAVINGRPSMWGDMMLAICMRSGKFDHGAFEETMEGEVNKPGWSASCTVKRTDSDKPRTDTFDIEDAKRAGIFDKNVWKTYPKRMIQMRARGFALRNAFPDVLGGLYSTEEMLADKALDALDLETAVQVATGREAATQPRSAREIAADLEKTNPLPEPEAATEQPTEPEPAVAKSATPETHVPEAEPGAADTRSKKQRFADRDAIAARVKAKWDALDAATQRMITTVPPAGIGVISAWAEKEILDLEIEIGDAAGAAA